MDFLWNLELQVVLWFQSLGTGVVEPMRLLALMGQQEFFLVVMPAIFWCLDAGAGLRTGAMLLLGSSLNCFLKILFHTPRPFWYSPQVKALSSETTFGMPSGHAQNAAGIWGLLAALVHKRWAWITALAVIFAIGVSRVYLGMHFPSDVVAGWLLGAALVWLFLRLDAPVTRWLKSLPFNSQIILGFAVSLALIGLFYLTTWSVRGVSVPWAWVLNASNADPHHPMNPLDPEGTFSAAGVWFGLSVGAAWHWRRGWFDARGSLNQRLLRYLMGVAGVGILYAGLGLLFPRSADFIGYAFRYLRYFLIGIWVAGGAPYLFIRFGLAQPSGVEHPVPLIDVSPQETIEA